MNKTDVSNFLKHIGACINEHMPQILTGFGIAGMAGAGVMAVQATPEALKLLESKKREKRCDKLPPVEVVKATWKCYLPAVIAATTSAACLIKANSISTRRHAALLTAYNLSKTAYSEYKDKVIETIGEKKEGAIKSKIAQDKIEKNPVDSREVIITETGNTLCLDGLFGRYFMSDRDVIERAMTRINRDIVAGGMYASLNEFYNEIGLSPVAAGDDLGWNLDDGEITVDFDYGAASDGRPCLIVSFNILPKYGYSTLF